MPSVPATSPTDQRRTGWLHRPLSLSSGRAAVAPPRRRRDDDHFRRSMHGRRWRSDAQRMGLLSHKTRRIVKGGDSLARDGVTVDRLLPLLHCPKPEMGEEEILYSPLTLEKTSSGKPGRVRFQPPRSIRRTNSLAARQAGPSPPRPVHLPTHPRVEDGGQVTLAHAATRNNREWRNHGGRREGGRGRRSRMADGGRGSRQVGRQHVGLFGAEHDVHGVHGSLCWAS